MPYIKLRKQADGTLRYTAIVRIRRNGKMLHQEAKTFTHRSATERWGNHREVALENPTALSRAQQPSTSLSNLIRWYIDSFEHISKWQRASNRNSCSLRSTRLAMWTPYFWNPQRWSITSALVAQRALAAKSVKGIPVRPEVVDEARTACRELRLVGKSDDVNADPLRKSWSSSMSTSVAGMDAHRFQ